MFIEQQRLNELNALCNQFRIDIVNVLHKIQTGHPGGSFSATEIVTTLYTEVMKHDSNNPGDPNRDRFIMSKGHAAPILYRNLAEQGYFPLEDFDNLRQLGCHLQGHPCALKTPGVELSTGPLGLGLSAGVGMALSARLDNKDFTTYVLLGDGEIQEGIIWEAAMASSKFALDNLVAILDANGVQLDGTTDEIMPMGSLRDKWASFGWNVIECDGHDIEALLNAFEKADKKEGMPTIIIAETIKGKGVSYMEGQNAWHGQPINKEHYDIAIKELTGGSHV